MKHIAALAALAFPVASNAAAPAPASAASPSIDDGHCVLALYMIVALNDTKQAKLSEDSAKAARDGFLYYSGKLSARGDAGFRAAVNAAAKDKTADLATVGTACIRRMGEQLDKAEAAVKAAK